MLEKALGLAAVVIVVIGIAIKVSHDPLWTPDGFAYARIALQDAGLEPAVALAKAEAFYLDQPVGRMARYRALFTVDAAHAPPAPGPIFRTRWLYPRLASILYPWQGFGALIAVSIAAYVVGSLLVYWLLLAFARPWVAAVGAILFGIAPLVLNLARSDLTDMLALALWVAALASVVQYLQRRQPWLLFSFGLSVLALALTRQAILLPIGAVAGALVSARLRHDADDTRGSLALSAVLGGVTIVSAGWYLWMHGAGIAKELDIDHNLAIGNGSVSPHVPVLTWYQRSVMRNIAGETKRQVLHVLPMLAALAVAWEIRRIESAVLIGATVAGLATFFLDPSASDLPRVLEAPLSPIVLAALAMGAEKLLRPNSLAAGHTTAGDTI